jgi:hypothetical protein
MGGYKRRIFTIAVPFFFIRVSYLTHSYAQIGIQSDVLLIVCPASVYDRAVPIEISRMKRMFVCGREYGLMSKTDRFWVSPPS